MDGTRARRAVGLAALGSAAAFCAVAVAVVAGATAAWDRGLLLAMRVPGDPDDPLGPVWFEEAAAEVTALGGYTILVLVSFAVLLALWLTGRRLAAALTLGSLVGGSIISSLLKALFSRPRPDIAEQFDRTFTSSFPSAHAMVATLAYLTLALLAARMVDHRGLRRLLVGGAVVLAVLIGTSRVYLGVHWPSDVLAGWLAGGCWACLAWLVADRITKSRETDATVGRSRL